MRRDAPPTTRSGPTGIAETRSLQHLSDEEVVLRAQNDPSEIDACVALLFERYGTKVTTWCRRLCRDPDLAEDAAQEVFLKVQQRVTTFEGGSRFTTWLYVLARNSTLDFLAARRNQSPGAGLEDLPEEPMHPDTPADSALVDRDLQERLRRAIRTELEPDEARVVVLHCVHGLTLPAVTELLGLENRSGAKALFVAAKRRLRAHFAAELSQLEGGNWTPATRRGTDG